MKLQNVKVVSSKCVKYHFWVNYPFNHVERILLTFKLTSSEHEVFMSTPATPGSIKVLSAEQNIFVIKLERPINMTDFYHYADMWINAGT